MFIKKYVTKPKLHILILMVLFGMSFQFTQDKINEKKLDFYTKILKSQEGNNNLEILNENGQFFLKTNQDIDRNTKFLTLSFKHVFTGCSFYPFREELQNMFHSFFLKYPKGGDNIFFITTLVYQLLYYKKGDKQSALNIYRDANKFSSSFFKFEATPEQMEYLDIISIKSNSKNLLNLPKELREKFFDYEIDELIFQTAYNLYNFVQQETQKLPKIIKNFLNSFVNEYDLYMTYFDYIYRFSHLSSFEDFTKMFMNKLNIEEFLSYSHTLLSKYYYPNNKCLLITPLFDLIKVDYKRDETLDFNLGVSFFIESNLPISIKNTIKFYKDSIIYRIIIDKPLKEVFLSDYGLIMSESENKQTEILLPITFKKEDFFLKDLTKDSIKNNLNIKNCLEYKCPISFDKLLTEGYSIDEFSFKFNELNSMLLASSKIMNLNNELDMRNYFKMKIANEIPISFENQIRSYLKYNNFLMRKNKVIKNSINFLREFYKFKVNYFQDSNNLSLILKEDYPLEFNYMIISYEKYLLKLNHISLVGDNIKEIIKENMKEIKKKYLID